MIYFPVPWIHRMNPVLRFPPQFPRFGVPSPQPTQASPLAGWEGPPLGLVTMNRGEPLAHKPRPSGQEADKGAGSGLGKWRDRETG